MGASHVFKCYHSRFFRAKKPAVSSDLYQSYAQNIGESLPCLLP